MPELVFITGNPKKLTELQRLLPSELAVIHQKLDLDEIQSLDVQMIVSHKLREAYEAVGKPVMVEDVSAELSSLNGLPGPFVKYFEQKLGSDALYKIGTENDSVKIICTMGYYDGSKEIIVDGILPGRIVAPRGEGGFGFDIVVVPDGYEETLAELGMDVKNKISHRAKAVQLMASELQKLL